MEDRGDQKGNKDHSAKVRCAIPHAPGAYFVAIPRTGSNSVCKSLGIKHLHRTAKRLKEMYDVLYTAAFVRDTYNHVGSWFVYHYKGHHRDLKRSFNGWVDKGLPLLEDFYPPDWAASDQDGHILDQCLYIESGVDFLGDYENLEEDFRALCYDLGLGERKLVKRYGVGDAKKQMSIDYRLLYTDQSRKIVEKMFEGEIDLLEYSF